MVGVAQFDFSGVTAIVTGSTKGIGRGIASNLADAGANVVINSRSGEEAENVADELAETSGSDVISVKADVGNPEEAVHLVEKTRSELGTIDLLVNNAAVWPPKPLHEQGLDEWDDTVGVNARAPYHMSLAALEDLKESSGNIINITSKAGERNAGDHGLYGVSKAAQNGLTWRLAYELAEYGIRVNAVSTEQTDSYQLRKTQFEQPLSEVPDEKIEETMRNKGDHIPLGRIGTPEDIADAVLFLASDAASYVTGHILRVSGGNNLQ
jgi:NAD(P)-dependent dehydrogenase (short-subunit alcohol dehydrogenase family)